MTHFRAKPSVYVSAASRGLGLAIAQRIALSAGRLAISSRGNHLDEALELLRRENPVAEIIGVRGDLSTAEGQEAILGQLADAAFEPDVFVCNAGHPERATIEELSRESWGHGMEMILGQALFATQRFLPGMAKRGFGRLIYISSIHAKVPRALPPEFLTTALARSALFALVKSVQQKYIRRGVAAFSVGLGYVDTPMLRNAATGRPIDGPPPDVAQGQAAPWQATYEEWAETIPAGRIASSQELAEVVAFLTSPAADYLNGQILHFSGGMDGCIL